MESMDRILWVLRCWWCFFLTFAQVNLLRKNLRPKHKKQAQKNRPLPVQGGNCYQGRPTGLAIPPKRAHSEGLGGPPLLRLVVMPGLMLENFPCIHRNTYAGPEALNEKADIPAGPAPELFTLR